MKAKIKKVNVAQITAFTFLLGALARSFAAGPSNVSPDEALKRLMQGNVAKQLHDAKPILAERVHSGKLKIVAARYDLDTGKVEFLPSS